ncbi:XAC2610-related protein [Xanthomonas arboricola]|uniref:XAC2610-related protein n=1 Tax=Xanthomonas arboricola TaxID=56448 RepID=UPI003989A5F6
MRRIRVFPTGSAVPGDLATLATLRLGYLRRLRVGAARVLLSTALTGLSFAAVARDTSVQVTIDAHTHAAATLVGERLHVVFTPGGKEQWIDANMDQGGGGTGVDSDDYNFDGHPDLAVSAMLGQVNEAVLVFVFDPAQRRFRALTAPTRPAVQCEGFFNLTPDTQQRSLTSSCRSGPMWYADVYRYAADGRLYVATTQQPIASPDIQTLLDPGSDDGMPLSVWPRYDARGVRVSSAIGTTLDAPMPVQLRVQVARLPLYATPTTTSTRRYLVQGDRADALDVSADATRVQIRYRSAGRGDIVGWIEVAAAMK